VIVPRELLSRIVGGRAAPPVIIAVDEDETVSVTQAQITTSSKAIPRTFPNWRKVIPASTSVIAAQINPRFMADVGKAARLVTGSRTNLPKIRHNGEGCVLVDMRAPDFVAAIMPFRDTKAPPYTPPAWTADVAESHV